MKCKNLKFIIAAAAAGLVLAAGVGSTIAYFTTYAESAGGYTISLGDREEINETVVDMTKHVTISSKEDSQPVFVRVRAFTGSIYNLVYSGSGWTDGGDGWWYYNETVPGGGTTSELVVNINNVPEDNKDDDSINIAVVFESTLAIYKYNSAADSYEAYADWNLILDEGGDE